MNGSRLAGVVLIFGIATAAWAILSGTMYSRTSRSEASLRPRVEGLWGGKHAQAAPTVAALSDVATGGQLHEPLLLDSSKIDVNLRADFRRKGLIWHRTYEVEFTGDYTVTNDSVWAREIEATLQFPSPGATYDGLDFSIKKTRARDASGGVSGVSITASAEPGETVPITVHYRSRGLDTWRYSFGPATAQVDNCTIAVSTNFARIDFPDATLAPTRKTETPDGWDLTWEFKSLVTGLGVAIDMPMQLDPGPWATRVSAFAPIGLFFFLSLLVIVGMLDGKRLHPMHYAFVCAAFFSFHLLLAYLVDHVHMHLAFSIAAICSVVLVVSYLLRAAGAKFTLTVAAPSQIIFLVLFSYSFFFPGYTGLAVTIGAVLTLAILMHLTAKVDWETKLGSQPPSPEPHKPSLGTKLRERVDPPTDA